jgi:fibronectin type 3 domain-containing protein
MHAAFFRTCMLGVVLAVCAILATPALADSSAPIGLTATARSDHRVDLAWSWPASPSFPDELQVWRDGAFYEDVPDPTATSFVDTIATVGSTHSYWLVTVTNGVSSDPIPADPGVPVTVRGELPNPATNIAVTFSPHSDLATITWTRGAADEDVTYTASARQGSGTPITRTVKYTDPGTDGSITIDGLASYATYSFTVTAVEDAEPPTDPGGSTPGATVTMSTPDIIAPVFNPGSSVVATRTSLGTVSVTWSSATDAGGGVASYSVCISSDCVPFSYDPLSGSTQTALPDALNIPNDGQTHAVTVTAVDSAGNISVTPLTTSIAMPLPATPSIVLTSGGAGCVQLIATVTSADAGTAGLAYHLSVDGVQHDALIGQPITGTAYQLVNLTAWATFQADSSLLSATYPERVVDPDGPEVSPQVHGVADPSSGTETLTWDPVTTGGAPVDGYQITSTGSIIVPGFGGPGVFVPQSAAPATQLLGLAQSVGYLIHVVTVDDCGRASSPSADRLFRLDDNEKPTAPGLNPPTTSGHDVHLTWAPSTDNVAVDDYRVYRDSAFIGRTAGTAFDDLNLPDASTYTYTVTASDTAGNSSLASTPRSVTTRDMTPPSVPGVVKATVTGGTAVLSWGAATDNVGVAGYRITRGGTVIATVTGSGTTSYTDKNLKAGVYQWTVQAVDAAGNLSPARSVAATSTGTPTATAASKLTVVSSKGAKSFRVGGKSGARIVLSFKLKDSFVPAYLRLQVVSGKAKLRISLPAGSGRTTPGKRLGEKSVKKGSFKIGIGTQKSGTLRLVVTAKGGLVTISGMSKGTKAPTISST